MGETVRDRDWLLVENDPIAHRAVWISGQDGMTVICTDYYGAAALREENAEAEKATHGRLSRHRVRIASVPLNEPAASGLDRAVREGHDRFLSLAERQRQHGLSDEQGEDVAMANRLKRRVAATSSIIGARQCRLPRNSVKHSRRSMPAWPSRYVGDDGQ